MYIDVYVCMYTCIDEQLKNPLLVVDGTYVSVFIIYVIATFLYGSMNKRALHYDGVSDLCLTSSNRCAYITT